MDLNAFDSPVGHHPVLCALGHGSSETEVSLVSLLRPSSWLPGYVPLPFPSPSSSSAILQASASCASKWRGEVLLRAPPLLPAPPGLCAPPIPAGSPPRGPGSPFFPSQSGFFSHTSIQETEVTYLLASLSLHLTLAVQILKRCKEKKSSHKVLYFFLEILLNSMYLILG